MRWHASICKTKSLASAAKKVKTVVFVTHDIEEAVVLADRVVVLAANPGRVQTIIPVNIIDRTDRTSANFVNIRNHIFEQFQLAKEDKIEFYI